MNPQKSPKIEAFEKLLGAPAFVSDEQCMKVFADLTGSDETAEKTALDHINDAIAMPWHFLDGKLSDNGVWNKYFSPTQNLVNKTAEGALLTHTGQSIALLSVYDMVDVDELTFDQEWRAAFQFHTILDSTTGKIVDVHNLVRWELIEDGEEIKFYPFKEDEATYLRPLRYGGGVSFSREDFERNPMVTMNMAIAACRFRSAELQKDNAYTILQAAWTTAYGAGQFTPLNALGLPQTINLTRNANIARNTAKGWGVNFSNTVVHAYFHPDHYGPVEAAFAQWFPSTAVQLSAPAAVTAPGQTDNPIEVVSGTIVRHYTFNLTADLGNVRTGNLPAGGFVLPRFKNKWGSFSPVEFHMGQNWKSRKVEVGGDELRNAQTETEQFDVIELS